jgi:hypothetical protein
MSLIQATKPSPTPMTINFQLIVGADGRTIWFMPESSQNGIDAPATSHERSGYRLRNGIKREMQTHFGAFIVSENSKEDIADNQEFVTIKKNGSPGQNNDEICREILQDNGLINISFDKLESTNPGWKCAGLKEGDLLLLEKAWRNPNTAQNNQATVKRKKK